METPYRVEARGEGCPTCQHGDQFDIVGPGGIAQSQSWGNREEVDFICELMNDAHAAGRADFARQILATANMEVKEDAEDAPQVEAPIVTTTPSSDDDIPF